MSVDAWATWGNCFFHSTDSISLLLYIFKTDYVKKIGFISGIIFFNNHSMSLIFLLHNKKENLVNRNEAIVMNPSVTVRSTQVKVVLVYLFFMKGRKVNVKDNSMKEWKEIHLEDGKSRMGPSFCY